MPRITDAIFVDSTRHYKAVRPQNGDTPATFREVADKSVIALSLLNLGVTQDKQRTRVRLSLVKPQLNYDGIVIDTNRVDVTVRLANTTSTTDVNQLKADLRAFIASNEFDFAIDGEQQY